MKSHSSWRLKLRLLNANGKENGCIKQFRADRMILFGPLRWSAGPIGNMLTALLCLTFLGKLLRKSIFCVKATTWHHPSDLHLIRIADCRMASSWLSMPVIEPYEPIEDTGPVPVHVFLLVHKTMFSKQCRHHLQFFGVPLRPEFALEMPQLSWSIWPSQ